MKRNAFQRLMQVFGLLAVLTMAISAQAAGLDDWYWRNPYPLNHPLSAVAYGNGVWVAVGGRFHGGTTILSSSDAGATWAVRLVESTEGELTGVTYGNGLFVAVGTGRILTSPDGISWTPRKTDNAMFLRGIAFGNGKFVAVGADGLILTSTNGIDWAQPASPTTRTFNAITFGQDVFVAASVPQASNGQFLVSPDGVNWQVFSSGTLDTINSIAYGAGSFVAVGSAGKVLTSTDAMTWTTRPTTSGKFLYSVAFGSGMFYAVGAANTVMTSTDGGVTWFVGSGPISIPEWSGVAYGDGNFVIVGDRGHIFTTDSSKVQILRSSGSRTDGFEAVAYGDDTFVTVATSGRTYRSTDGGKTWSVLPGQFDPYKTGYCLASDLIYADGKFVVTCSNGGIAFSTDAGLNWIGTDEQTMVGNPTAVTHGASLFVAASLQGYVLTSPDAINWTPQNSGTTKTLWGLAYGNGVYVAVGEAGTLLVSTNAGVDWVDRSSAVTGGMDLFSAAYGKGRFVVVGQDGTAFTSTDGLSWQQLDTGELTTLRRVIYASGRFVAIGSTGMVLSSSDGLVWTKHGGKAWMLAGLAFGNDTFVAVGGYGAILQSAPVPMEFALTIHKSGSGKGEVTVTGCTLTWDPKGTLGSCNATGGTHITLTTTADAGSVFAGWENVSGSAGCSGTAKCTFNLAQDSSVTARFDTVGASGSGGGGCFIATAAFGSPWAQQVRILRDFRDQVLMVSPSGRAFVTWYYRTSPEVSHWIVEHPWSKPVVRALLYPVIAAAWMQLHGAWVLLLAGIVMGFLILVVFVYRRRHVQHQRQATT